MLIKVKFEIIGLRPVVRKLSEVALIWNSLRIPTLLVEWCERNSKQTWTFRTVHGLTIKKNDLTIGGNIFQFHVLYWL